MHRDETFDVAIVGGGPGASVAALTLREAGARVAILAAPAKGARRGHGECLPPAGTTWLQHLGLGGALKSCGVLPIVAQRSRWGADTVESSDLIRSAHGGAWIVDRAELDRILLEAATGRGTTLLPSPDPRVVREGDLWSIEADGSAVRARYLIDATGRRAAIAHRLGARTRCHDRLVVLARRATTHETSDVDSTTLIESTSEGWWYSCRTGPRERLLAFFTDADLLPTGREARVRLLERQLAKTDLLAGIVATHRYCQDGEVRSAIARSSILDPLCGQGWLAAGDAAAAHDPLCGHGIIAAMDGSRWAALSLIAAARGRADAMDTYAAFVRERHRAYRLRLADLYAAETRLQTHPFWLRRRGRIGFGGRRPDREAATTARLARRSVFGEARVEADFGEDIGQ